MERQLEDERYMRRAIYLATLDNGYARPNPKVGSVIVYKDKIIGEGFHQCYGNAHAEVNAIASVAQKSLLSKSTIYVTLEPCFHYGKTPPCVELILKNKIPRVVIGMQDPFSKVAGKSIEKLRNAAVEVKVGVLEKEVAWLNRRFLVNIMQQRPYVILKYAVSSDNFMGRVGQNIKISNAFTQRLVHRWRAEEAAIMVGTNTARVDDPNLGNRLYFGSQPLRVVLDRKGCLRDDLQLFNEKLPTLVFSEQERKSSRATEYVKQNFKSPNFLPSLLEELHKRKIQSLLVEGGAELLQSFLDAHLWDEIRILKSQKELNYGIAAPQIYAAKMDFQQFFGNTSFVRFLPKEKRSN